ncbi:hypothetical protein GALL_420050 [mine drainage metagenome]|uniref:Uncharacterized protein n=1 Tax=mine drainage metagenome TaxID=410659 RepID=A0A1J5PZC1_9ZZZZ
MVDATGSQTSLRNGEPASLFTDQIGYGDAHIFEFDLAVAAVRAA